MTRLLLLLGVVCVSSAALFAHRALLEATPLAVAAWRLGFAAVFFLAWELVGGRQTNDRQALTMGGKARLVLAGVCLGLHFLVWFASLRYIPVARSTLLVCTTPLWAALGGVFLKRRPSRLFWLALGLAAVGIWLVTRAASEAHTLLSLRGDLLALSGGLFIAIYLIAVEGLHTSLSTRRQVTMTYTVAALALWVVLSAQGGVTLHYSAGVWAAIVGMAVGPQILGHTLLNNALRHFPSSTVAFSLLLEPVVAALLAWALLRQGVTPGQVVGGLLVLAGLAVVILQRSDAAMSIGPAEERPD